MKNYQSAQLLRELGSKFEIKGRTITVTVTGNVGIGTWSKLDYMKKCGYSIVRKVAE